METYAESLPERPISKITLKQLIVTDLSASRGESKRDPSDTRANFSPSAFDYILGYLEICFFLCIIPFRVNRNGDNGYYEITECFYQKFVSISLNLFLASYNLIWHACLFVQRQTSDDPIKFFTSSEAIIQFFYIIAFVHLIFFKKAYFKSFLKLSQQYYSCAEKSSLRNKYIVQLVVVLGNIIFGMVNVWFSYVTKEASLVNTCFTTSNQKNNATTMSCYVIVGDNILSLFHTFWQSMAESLCILLFGFGWFLKQICEDLKEVINKGDNDCMEILEQYLRIKDINECVNSITKYLVIIYTIGSIPFISNTMIEFSVTKPLIILKLTHSGAGFFISMLGSAEAHSKAIQLKHALLKRHLKYNDGDLMTMNMLLSEFSTPDIGLRGMDFFVLSYSFAGVLISQCIVYALIILQLKGPPA